MTLRLNRYYIAIAVVNIAVILALLCVIAPFEAVSVAVNVQHAEAKTNTKKAISGVPNRIVIPSLRLDIRVKIGSYDQKTKQWTISDDGAYYADYSIVPNDTIGTSLIYGHARWGIFGALPDLPEKADLYVYTESEHVFHYQYIAVTNVEPSNTNIFSRKGVPQLVLQTCSGAWSQYRSLYTFSFVEVT